MEQKNTLERPSSKWYLLPIILFFIGPLLSVYLLYSVFTSPIHTVNFFIPGNFQIVVTQPGDYTLWAKFLNKDAIEQFKKDAPNIHITIANLAKRTRFEFTPKIGWTDTRDDITHLSLGTVKLLSIGKYQVSSISPYNHVYKVYLRQPSFFRYIKALAFTFLLILSSIVAALLSAIIILIKRIQAKPMDTNVNKPIPNQVPTAPSNEATTWAMICHLSGFIGFIFPFGNIIAPLIIWGVKRQEWAYLDQQGKEAINFQISVSIYYIICVVLIILIVGLVLLPLLAAFQIIAMIIASIESAHGKPFRYPLTFRFLQ